MMSTQLLEIQPRELKFIFELKKQSSCSVRLINNTHHFVAFKVKTTSPRKYCVRPNVGVIMPKSTREFLVTMQAQRQSPPDMACKDKFLIQSTVVPAGTTDEDITSSIFAKDDGRYIEENKLRVTLASPPHSPMLSPINGTLKQGEAYGAAGLKEPELSTVGTLKPMQLVAKSEELKMVNGEDLKPIKNPGLTPRKEEVNDEDLKPTKNLGLAPRKDGDGEDLKPTKNPGFTLRKEEVDAEDLKPAKDPGLISRNDGVNGEGLKPTKDPGLMPRKDEVRGEGFQAVKNVELEPRKDEVNGGSLQAAKNVDLKPMDDISSKELKRSKDVESKQMEDVLDTKEITLEKDTELETVKGVEEKILVKDIEEMKSKLNELESKLGEAQVTISKLTEERSFGIRERKMLQEELAMLRKKTVVRRVQVGFPLLFVCMVAFVSVILGSLLRS